MHRLFPRAVLLGALLPWGAAGAQPAIDVARSSILAGFKQMGVTINGRFQKFAGSIEFDPARPELAQVRFDVDSGSFDLGDESYNQEVRGKLWMNAAVFPKAQFVSSAVRQTGPGRYLVNGRLSIKGTGSEVAIPVTFKQDGAAQVFDGALTIKRLQFKVGEQEWRDTALVADEVQLNFHIVKAAR